MPKPNEFTFYDFTLLLSSPIFLIICCFIYNNDNLQTLYDSRVVD